MKKLKRLAALLLCMLLPWQIPAAADTPAPTVRIQLKRLGLTDRADLWSTGPAQLTTGAGTKVYLPSNAELTLQIRDNSVYLFMKDISMSCGSSLTLSRTAGAESGGFRFSENGNLYPGDLRFTISGGQLMPVLTVSVEDYLLGVVPYEMSDDFPLEALKAQAVCARTYALSHLDGTKEFDMTDTTAHQVFRGVDARNERTARAVRETAGVVGTWKDALAVFYYAASNGGQTELPGRVWPGSEESAGCYDVREDPYDLENPESPVLKAKLRKDGGRLPEAFLSLLAAQLSPVMQKNRLDTDAESLRVTAISEVSLSEPLFDGSLCMTAMNIRFSWSGRKILGGKRAPAGQAASTAAPGSIMFDETPQPTLLLGDYIPMGETTLKLRVHSAVLDALGLSISSTEREILTVTEERNSFVLSSRRYGHGVGMSQRGAQRMAGTYGMDFTQILSFYYPGMVLKVAPSGAAVLPTADPRLAMSPAPAASPTPRPTLMPVTADRMPAGAWLAEVAFIDDDSSLNLRQQPSTAAEILMRLYKGQRLMVLERCEEEGWVHVRTDSIEGYVMERFLEVKSQ